MRQKRISHMLGFRARSPIAALRRLTCTTRRQGTSSAESSAYRTAHRFPTVAVRPSQRAQAHQADLNLVRQAIGSSPKAIEALLTRMGCARRFVLYRNKRLGGILSTEEAEDAIQEALFAIWRKLADYEGRASLETWIYRFCQLEVSKRLRQRYRGPLLLEDVEVDEPVTPPKIGAFEYDDLYRSLEVLGPPNADIIKLKHLQALTFEEIGRRLGLSANTVKTQYYRGMKTLRELYPSGAVESRKEEA